jgi:hypothetical protein
MKRSYLFIAVIILFFFSNAIAQQKTPTLLKSPADWGFERIDMPFGFALGIKYSGFEEIRFAPGMFDTTSTNYFTYAFVVSFDGTPSFDANKIKDFLDKYYKGLCISVGQPKSLTPDTSQVKADVQASIDNYGKDFIATVNFFDTFSNGRKITLYMEIEITAKLSSNKTYMTVLICPGKDNKVIWDKLHEIKGNITLN